MFKKVIDLFGRKKEMMEQGESTSEELNNTIGEDEDTSVEVEENNDILDENEDTSAIGELLLNPKQEREMSPIYRKNIEDDLAAFPPIKENEVTIHTSYVFEQKDDIEACFYIRNGVSTPINFEKLPLSIIDADGNVIITENIDLSEVGIIPAGKSKMVTAFFNKNNIVQNGSSLQNSTVVFGKNVEAHKSVDVELENNNENITEFDLERMKRELKKLPLVKENQVDINTIGVINDYENNLIVNIVIRNGSNQAVTLNHLPLQVYEADDVLIAEGEFDFTNVVVNPRKAQVIACLFKSEDVYLDEYDLSAWRVLFQKEEAVEEPIEADDEVSPEIDDTEEN